MGVERMLRGFACLACVLLAWPQLVPAKGAISRRRPNAAKRYYDHVVQVDENKHDEEFFSFVTVRNALTTDNIRHH